MGATLMSENNGILMAEDVELDPSPEPPLPRKVVQRERLKLAADMMVLFQADLSPRVSKRVALLTARVVSDLAQLSLEQGKR